MVSTGGAPALNGDLTTMILMVVIVLVAGLWLYSRMS